jgi:hypothetical protein
MGRTVVSFLVLAGCAPRPTPDQGPSPPVLRSAIVSVSGDFATDVDITATPVTHVLPSPQPATVRVIATSTSAQAADLRVALYGADGSATPFTTFKNGAWSLDATLTPGIALTVQVDAQGAATSAVSGTLTVPTRAAALAGKWETRFFATDKTIAARNVATWQDGAWSEDRPGGVHASGTYSVAGELLSVSESGVTRSGAFYVDEVYASVAPWSRDAGSGLSGVWHREGESLTLSAGAVTDGGVAWDGSFLRGVSGATGETGYYRVVPNDNYANNYGDFLHQKSSAAERFELFVIRDGHLLVTPMLRQ